MQFPAPSPEADATRPVAESLMPGAGGASAGIGGLNQATSHPSAIVARQTAFTAPGAPAPGQHEDEA